jgi:hypothetical protein
LIGLGGVRNITLGKNPIADDAANLGIKTGSEPPKNVEPTGNPAGANSEPPKNVEATGKAVGAIDDTKAVQSSSLNFDPNINLGGISDDLSRAFLSPDEFASLPSTGKIESGKIRFSQDSINANFKPPFGSVDDFITDLKLGKVDPASIKPIRIVEKDGQVFTLDNRRLHAFQQAGIEVPFQKLDRIPKRELFKFTTKNEGLKIEIRR